MSTARGRGLGGRALELIEAEARRLAVRRLYLEVEHLNRALDLYAAPPPPITALPERPMAAPSVAC